MTRMALLSAIYLLGVVIGLIRVDGSLATRVGVAVLWPLGAVAGVVTVSGLLAATLVLFPLVGVAVAIAGGVLWWFLA
jgi:hypothetical protein